MLPCPRCGFPRLHVPSKKLPSGCNNAPCPLGCRNRRSRTWRDIDIVTEASRVKMTAQRHQHDVHAVTQVIVIDKGLPNCRAILPHIAIGQRNRTFLNQCRCVFTDFVGVARWRALKKYARTDCTISENTKKYDCMEPHILHKGAYARGCTHNAGSPVPKKAYSKSISSPPRCFPAFPSSS